MGLGSRDVPELPVGNGGSLVPERHRARACRQPMATLRRPARHCGAPPRRSRPVTPSSSRASRGLRRAARHRGRLVLGRGGRAAGGDRRQRRRQDDAVQRHHRRLPADRGPRALLRRGHHRRCRRTSASAWACAAPTSRRCCSATSRCATTCSSRCAAWRAAASSFLRPRAGASVARARPTICSSACACSHVADEPVARCRTASSASSRSAWRWPARRA